jgi:type I restriction enzyme R subunit
VYESVKPADKRGALIWAALGAKTLELVHEGVTVAGIHPDAEILELSADLIDQFFEKNRDKVKVTAKRVEINLVARIGKHGDNPIFIKLGDRLEELREKHAQGLVTSIEFLKLLLDIAKDLLKAEKETPPKPEQEKGIAALTELFSSVKNANTPIIVERIVKDIDNIVKIVRFPGWQNTSTGRDEIKKQLRKIIWAQYKIKDSEVFNKAYKYIEMYY